ncbi:MAG: PKD domain-containing protein, partial [Planctomycetes bacterium]|nr:PKD domain-containing protein [Planctomycetota bacterium]
MRGDLGGGETGTVRRMDRASGRVQRREADEAGALAREGWPARQHRRPQEREGAGDCEPLARSRHAAGSESLLPLRFPRPLPFARAIFLWSVAAAVGPARPHLSSHDYPSRPRSTQPTMNSALFVSLATALSASLAIAQVTIPPHSAIYNGFTRGYTFTAQTQFLINQLELPLDALQAGDTAGFLVRVNGAIVFRSVGNATAAIPANIIVNNGDVVDVMGNWSPAVTGNFSAHNSYTASMTNFATSILGVPHTIQRSGWQWDIGDPNYLSGTFLPPTTGQMGRVFIYAVPLAGLFPNFTADVTGGVTPLTVNFTDQSYSSAPGGVLAWAWDFDGDTVIDSTLQNPTWVYTTCGSYNVSLTVFDSTFPPATLTRTAYINTDRIAANFTSQVIGPLLVQF